MKKHQTSINCAKKKKKKFDNMTSEKGIFKDTPKYSLLKLRAPDRRVSISEPKPKAS